MTQFIKKNDDDCVIAIIESEIKPEGDEWEQFDGAVALLDEVSGGVITTAAVVDKKPAAWNWAQNDLFDNDLASHTAASWERAVRLGRKDKMTATMWSDLITDSGV